MPCRASITGFLSLPSNKLFWLRLLSWSAIHYILNIHFQLLYHCITKFSLKFCDFCWNVAYQLPNWKKVCMHRSLSEVDTRIIVNEVTVCTFTSSLLHYAELIYETKLNLWKFKNSNIKVSILQKYYTTTRNPI